MNEPPLCSCCHEREQYSTVSYCCRCLHLKARTIKKLTRAYIRGTCPEEAVAYFNKAGTVKFRWRLYA